MNIKTKLLALAKMAGVYIGFTILMALIGFPISIIFPRSFRNSDIWAIVGTSIMVTVAIAYNFLLFKVFAKKEKPKCGFAFENKWFIHFISSAALGVVCMIIIWLIAILFHGFTVRVNDLNYDNISYILIQFVAYLLVGFWEEIPMRGFTAYFGNTGGKWFVAIILSLVFAFSHASTPFNILFYINLYVWSIIAFILTWISGDLWSSIGFHFSWNFVMGGLLGIAVSGYNARGLFVSEYNTENIINGGNLGLEGSIIWTIVLMVTLISLYVVLKNGKIKNKTEVK
jgi:membrane protease YdiL (CAAX protease family)